MSFVGHLIIWLWKLAAILVGVFLVTFLIGICLAVFLVMPFYRRKQERKTVVDLTSGNAAIAELVSIQKASGARVFAISGTLLGIHRDGEIIAHDNDLDFGIFADDPHLVEFIRMMQSSKRFKLAKQFHLGWLGRLMNPWIPAIPQNTLLHKFTFVGDGSSCAHLDVFVHFAVSPDVIAHGSTRSQWFNSTFGLAKVEYKGLPLLVPADRPQYLRENYGVWEISVKDFESSLDCPNYHPILTVEAAALVAWKFVKFSLSGNGRRASALGARAFRFTKMCLFPRKGFALPEALRKI